MSSNGKTPVIVPTREGYDRWAPLYDREDNPLITLEGRHIAALLGEVAGRDVLDVGCGTGRHAIPLARAGARVTAVDFSAGMLGEADAKARAEGLSARFLVHDLHQPLPFPDQAFDLVLCCLVLEHISALDPFVADLGRVCRPLGRVVLSAMHPAMFLTGASARFTDPVTGDWVHPQSHRQGLADYVMAASRAGLAIRAMSEHAVDDELIARSPRAERYRGWPMLVLMQLTPCQVEPK
jgi:ubiquinone/menaquinone biosynthesis C-methylase UbiE